MRTKFLLIFSVFLALAGTCFAKVTKVKRPVQPVYLNSQPARVKPVFDKATFEKGSRVRSARDRATFEKPVITKRQIEKPKFDHDQHDKAKWDKTVLETKWQTETEPVLFQAPTETKAQSKVKRGWFRSLRAP